MPLTHDDINLYIFLKKVIEFKHMVGNWEKDNYHGIKFDPWINEWTKRVFTKRMLPQYVNLFIDRDIFDKVYSGLLFRPELKFLSAPELLKTDEEEGLGDDFHAQVKDDLDKLAPQLKAGIYPSEPAVSPAKTGAVGKPLIIPSEEEPETMESRQEPQAQTQQPLQQAPAQPSIPAGGGQPIQMPSVPQIPRPSIPRPKIPSAIKSGLKSAGSGMGSMLRDFADRGGKFLLGPGMNALSASSRASARGFAGKASRKVGLAFAGGLILLMVAGVILPSIFSEQPTVVAAPVVPPGNIASCSFTRADQTPKTAVYKSPVLMGYFQEASAISTVPAVVLAGFARVESPSLVNKTDADLVNLSSISGCPRSPTGALGVMQLQPPGTLGHAPEPINNGAKYIGKTVDSLTEADYCDVRTSIIVASGFLLKKLQLHYNLGDGTKWDPSWTNNKDVLGKLGEVYYGCPKYGAPGNVPCSDPRNVYGYGDDILASVQACQSTSPVSGTASCPVVGGTVSTPSYSAGRASGKNNGHCDPDSYSYACNCGISGRRAKAIDVPTNGQDVVLPKIANQDVFWTMAIAPYTVDSGEGGGVGYTFKASLGTDTWYLDVLHLQPSTLKMGENYLSGTPIGKSAISHAHMTVGKNLGVNPVAGTGTDCNSNWMPSDFMCQ